MARVKKDELVIKGHSAATLLAAIHKVKAEHDGLPDETSDALDVLHDWAEDITKSDAWKKKFEEVSKVADLETAEKDLAAVVEIEEHLQKAKDTKKEDEYTSGEGEFKEGMEGCIERQVNEKGMDADKAAKVCQLAMSRSKKSITAKADRVMKRDGEGNFDMYIPIAKVNAEKRLVTGIVYEPDVVDAQGDSASEEEIEKSAHDFLAKSRKTGLMHKTDVSDKVTVVESWITRNSEIIGNQRVRKGTWLMTMKVADDGIWNDVKSGKYTGFSMSGRAVDAAKA